MRIAPQRQEVDSNTQNSAPSCHRLFVEVSTDLLRGGRSVRFRAPGRSMQPTILDGEVITVAPVAPREVNRGDIILYRSTLGVTAHRVRRIERRHPTCPLFTLRGDAPGSPDELVAARRVLGKVVCVERGGQLIDPCSWKAMAHRGALRSVSRLKRWIVSRSRVVQSIQQFLIPSSPGGRE